VWAFGMTVYEILTNDRPFNKHKEAQVVTRLLKGDFPKQPTFSDNPSDAQIERYMWSVCERCRETDPTLRPRMADLEVEIEQKVAEIGLDA